jgi:hypothetical protein
MEGERRTSCYESPVSHAQHANSQAKKMANQAYSAPVNIHNCRHSSFSVQRNHRSVGSCKLSLVLTSTVSLGFGTRRDPCAYFCSFQAVYVFFNWGPLLSEKRTVILGSESRGTHNYILLSHGSGSRVTLFRQVSCVFSPVQSSPVNCCCSSPAVSFLVSSPVGIHGLIYVRSKTIYVFGSGVASSTRGGFVFLGRHHICCTVICARQDICQCRLLQQIMP